MITSNKKLVKVVGLLTVLLLLLPKCKMTLNSIGSKTNKEQLIYDTTYYILQDTKIFNQDYFFIDTLLTFKNEKIIKSDINFFWWGDVEYKEDTLMVSLSNDCWRFRYIMENKTRNNRNCIYYKNVPIIFDDNISAFPTALFKTTNPIMIHSIGDSMGGAKVLSPTIFIRGKYIIEKRSFKLLSITINRSPIISVE